MPRDLGKLLIVGGAFVALLGVAIHFGWLAWFGRLPGDIRVEGEHSRVYVPLTSMLLVSIALSLVVWLARRIGS
jgi:hypothetical protein